MTKKAYISFILCLSLILSIIICAYGEGCPLPAENCNADIKFSGFEWYTDYQETVTVATNKGITNSFDWSRDNFEADSCVTPHWTTIYNSINSFAGSETGCGGYLSYSSDIPNVAGYKIDDLNLYFMWNLEKGITEDYTQKDALQFYMAKYTFDVTDKEACYNDLLGKLKSLYGENPSTDTYGWLSETVYTCWVNPEGAMVALSWSEYDVTLIYMAPGAEEKLCEVEKMVTAKEITDAAGDLTGL
ncbi:MAG: hypothetical protein Q4F31_09455 [Eubacteriales bacterium]|nr:hypothetical protein [Eubacteriales bacterium]